VTLVEVLSRRFMEKPEKKNSIKRT